VSASILFNKILYFEEASGSTLDFSSIIARNFSILCFLDVITWFTALAAAVPSAVFAVDTALFVVLFGVQKKVSALFSKDAEKKVNFVPCFCYFRLLNYLH